MPFLVVVIAMVVVLAIAVAGHHENARQAERLREVAERLHGRVVPASLFGGAELLFPLKGQHARMTFAGGKQPWTRLQVLLPPPAVGRLSIKPDSLGLSLLRMVGIRDVEIGDRVFDATYHLRSAPESLARTVFAPERRAAAMLAVRRLNHCHGFSLTIRGRMLEVRVMELLDSAGVILAMARTAEDFMDFVIPAVPTEGIALGECRDGDCPVCGTALEGAIHRCGRCRAPHHLQCWTYLGRCATYGCDPRPRRAA